MKKSVSKKNKKRKGFTLPEVVVVVFLISLLSLHTFISFNNTQKYLVRANLYSQALYTALADVNRGVPIDEETPSMRRVTTITNENGVDVIETIVRTRLDQGTPIDIKFVRYSK